MLRISTLHNCINSTFRKLNSSSSQGKDHGPVSHCRGHHNIAFTDCEEPGRNPRRRTLLHRCGPILQICPLQHPQDPDIPHKRRNASNRWSSLALVISLLGYCNSWQHHCRASRTLQRVLFSVYPNSPMRPPPPPWPPLPSCCSPPLIQDDDISFQGSRRKCTHLPLHAGQTTHPSASTSATLAGRLIPSSLRSDKGCSATLLCFGASVVERTPDQRRDSRVTRHLPQKTQDSLVQAMDAS